MKEQISALMDGELDLENSPHLYTNIRNHINQDWAVWHLIGDTMRGEAMVQPDLYDRVMQKIESEPTIIVPRRRILDRLRSAYALPVAASAAALAFVSLMVWQSHGDISLQHNPEQASIAEKTMPPEALNSYMLAHHEYASSNGLHHRQQIRPVTFTERKN